MFIQSISVIKDSTRGFRASETGSHARRWLDCRTGRNLQLGDDTQSFVAGEYRFHAANDNASKRIANNGT